MTNAPHDMTPPDNDPDSPGYQGYTPSTPPPSAHLSSGGYSSDTPGGNHSGGGFHRGDHGPGPGQGFDPHMQGYNTAGAGYAAPSSDEKTAAILAHVSALIAMLISAGLLSYVGPFLVWLVYKDKSPYVRRAAAGSFNFNLSMAIITFLSYVAFFTIIGIPLAILGWIIAFLGQVIWHLIATTKAVNGEEYRYPLQTPVLS